ncbi:MAG: 50S ribosomal protein L18 [Candidatus Micrarchaeia archaeon]
MGKATGPIFKVPFRRRRENRTNYTKRLAMIKSDKPRFVARQSNKGMIIHLVQFSEKGDKTLVLAKSGELSAHGWMPQANTPTAYLTGALAAKKALQKGIKHAHLDIGMATASKGRILFAAALGAKDAGLDIIVPDTLLDKKRINGSHISDYASKLYGEDKKKFESTFSMYILKNVDVRNLPKIFEQVKGKILG